MSYIGDFTEDYATLNTKFTTVKSTGAPTVLAGTPVISVYKANGVTQSTAGITLSVDFDGVVGLNNVLIDLSADAFYAVGNDYQIVITTGTVDGVSVVGYVVAEFSIENRFMRGTDGANTTTPPTVAAIADGVHDEPLSGHQTQGTAGAALTMAAYLGPRGPGVYIDDAAANTGTTLGDDGTLENPVSTIAAATTIATALGVKRFYLINDTLITLAQIYEDYEFVGIGLGNQVTLGSQDVDNTKFYDLTVTGTQGGTGMMYTEKCTLNALLSAEIIALGCWLLGDNALRAATNHTFDFCSSAVPGSGTPELTFPAGVTNVNFRHYSGGIQLNNGISTSTISIECDGQIIVDATCVSMNVVYRGNCSLTDNGTTTSLTQDAAITRAAINAEMLDVLNVDTFAEPASVPAATSTIIAKLAWLFTLSRNKGTQTNTTKTLRNDADVANIATSAISDDATTFTRSEWV